MASSQIVESLEGVVETVRVGRGRASLGLLAVACGKAFDPLADLGYPVLGMELRGYGESRAARGASGRAHETGPYQLTHYIADFDAAMDSAKWKRAAVFGYSHAGFFAAAYALARPDRVAALVLVEPAIGISREELLHRARLVEEGRAEESLNVLYARVEPTVGLQDAAVRKASSTVLRSLNEERSMAGELLARADHPLAPSDLRALEMPVLIVGGTRSSMARTVSELGAAIPFASTVWIPGARHSELLQSKHAKALGGAINAFLTGVNGAGREK